MMFSRFFCAIALLILTACTGGGGGVGHTITGVSASGAAMVAAKVEAVCRRGSGSGVSGADGSFSITIPGGEGPCLLRATDPVTGIQVHSLLEIDAMQSVANVTPLTDLIVAKALGVPPSQAFAQFSTNAILQERLTRLQTEAAIAATKLAVNNLGATLGTQDDPLKGSIVTATNEAMGNSIDRAIDILMATLAAADKRVGELSANLATDPTALSSVATTALSNCPAARSGEIWMIDFTGFQPARYRLTFTGASSPSAGTLTLVGGNNARPITAQVRRCTFTVDMGATSREFRISDSGLAVWKDDDQSAGVSVPVQESLSFTVPTLQGNYAAMSYIKVPLNDTAAQAVGRPDIRVANPYRLALDGQGQFSGNNCAMGFIAGQLPDCQLSIGTGYSRQIANLRCNSPVGGAMVCGYTSPAGTPPNEVMTLNATAVAFMAGGNVNLFIAITQLTLPPEEKQLLQAHPTQNASGVLILNKAGAASPMPQAGTLEAGSFWYAGYHRSGQAIAGDTPAITTSDVNTASATFKRDWTGPTDASQATPKPVTHYYDKPTPGLVSWNLGNDAFGYRMASPAGWSFTVESTPQAIGGNVSYPLSDFTAHVRRAAP